MYVQVKPIQFGDIWYLSSSSRYVVNFEPYNWKCDKKKPKVHLMTEYWKEHAMEDHKVVFFIVQRNGKEKQDVLWNYQKQRCIFIFLKDNSAPTMVLNYSDDKTLGKRSYFLRNIFRKFQSCVDFLSITSTWMESTYWISK